MYTLHLALEGAGPEQHNTLRLVSHSWNDVVKRLPVPTPPPPPPLPPLPVELLQQIFREAVGEFNTDPVYQFSDITAQFQKRKERLDMLLNVMGVCQTWRDVVFVTKDLWTDIPLNCHPKAYHHPSDILTHWLPRAYDPKIRDGAILSLREFGNTKGEKFTLRSLYRRVLGLPAGNYWKGIVCDGNLEEVINLLLQYSEQSGGKWTMQKIHYLELSRNMGIPGPWRHLGGDMNPPLLTVFPNLETLRVNARSCSTLPNIVAPDLKRLEITEVHGGRAWALNQLQHSPNIESLHCLQPGHVYPDLPIPDLPNLRTATLDCGFPLAKLVEKAPKLESLTIVSSANDSRYNFNCLSPDFPELKLVVMGERPHGWKGMCSDLWETLLSKDGTMERLVVDCSRTIMHDGTAILKAIAKKSHASPRAKHVEFINMSFDVASSEEIAIKTRLRGMKCRMTLKGCNKTLLEVLTEEEQIFKQPRSLTCPVATMEHAHPYEVIYTLKSLDGFLEPDEPMEVEEPPPTVNLRPPREAPPPPPPAPDTTPESAAQLARRRRNRRKQTQATGVMGLIRRGGAWLRNLL